MKKHIKYIYSFIILMMFSVSTVLADTVTEVSICESPGVLRTLKIIGILLVLVKIILPLLLIIMSIIDFGKSAIAGNTEDLKKNTTIFFKRCLASAIILILPTFINFLFDTLVDRETSKYTACNDCLLNTSNCQIPDKEPEIYQ